MDKKEEQKLANMDLTSFVKYEKDLFIVMGIFAALALYIPQWASNFNENANFNITPKDYGLILESFNILDFGVAASLLIVIIILLLIVNDLMQTGDNPVFSIYIGSKSLLKLIFGLILVLIIGFLLFIFLKFNAGILIDLFALIFTYLGIWIIFSSYSWLINFFTDKILAL